MSEAKRVMENYHKAREIVAKEVAEKYGLVETYRNDEELKMESDNYVFNYLFIIPYCDELYIAEKGKTDDYGKSFKDLIFDKYSKIEDVDIEYKKIYAPLQKISGSDEYSVEILTAIFLLKTDYLKINFPEYFEISSE